MSLAMLTPCSRMHWKTIWCLLRIASRMTIGMRGKAGIWHQRRMQFDDPPSFLLKALGRPLSKFWELIRFVL